MTELSEKAYHKDVKEYFEFITRDIDWWIENRNPRQNRMDELLKYYEYREEYERCAIIMHIKEKI